ncbi:MAG: cytochrome c nitrite reductase small subunit [Pseudomonadota bacterium]
MKRIIGIIAKKQNSLADAWQKPTAWQSDERTRMKTDNLMKYIALGSVIILIGLSAYVGNASNMISYLSEDPKVCINCHVMNPQYATWQHSSHRETATCVDCHLPMDSFVDKMIAKSRDGFNHSVAMTLRTYPNNVRISDNASLRVQKNCISCHSELVSNMMESATVNRQGPMDDRKCWDCHRMTPHGSTRSLTSTPNNIGVKELYKLTKGDK